MTATRGNGGALHFMGLLSDGGVHSHLNHLVALLEMAAQKGLQQVYVHAFMDGRDTPPQSGAGYIRDLQRALDRIGTGRVATVCGRYYAMDRDNRWDRVQKAWQMLVDGNGLHRASNPVAAVQAAYERGETDEFILPTVVTDVSGDPVATLRDGDAVVFFNFRADRARQLTQALTGRGFDKFVFAGQPRFSGYVTFTIYDKNFDLPVAFPPQTLTRILGEVVSDQGLKQLRIAETEKYAHVTYFFNGGRETPFPGEERALIPSPKEVPTYDQKPEMSAAEVTEELLRRLEDNPYRLIVLNFANGDMVGHSGNLGAAIKACEAVDRCLGRLVARIKELGGTVLITSDHGNAEIMKDKDGGPFTAHSSNPVPFILIDDARRDVRLRTDGTLTNIAPTILELLGLPVPAEMESRSLIEKG
jgi:2,3-bisphosphoglycerate-independent phosphoglycerate mutase